MWTQLPSPKKGDNPLQFSAHVQCGQTAGCIKIPLGTKVGLGPGYIVLDGDPAPPLPGGSPQFSAHICCSQTAGWIKMPLGGPGHIVLQGIQLSPKGAQPTNFRPMSIVAKRPPISATVDHLLLSFKPAVTSNLYRYVWPVA